jgi:hypothetical protein
MAFELSVTHSEYLINHQISGSRKLLRQKQALTVIPAAGLSI